MKGESAGTWIGKWREKLFLAFWIVVGSFMQVVGIYFIIVQGILLNVGNPSMWFFFWSGVGALIASYIWGFFRPWELRGGTARLTLLLGPGKRNIRFPNSISRRDHLKRV